MSFWKLGQQGHDSRAIANVFVEKSQQAKRRLTIMPLIKYVYMAHGWTLGYTGKPLICHQVEAWKHGPVIPEVYRAFGHQMVVSQKVRMYDPEFSPLPYYEATLDEAEAAIVDKVYEKYSELGAFALSELTHREGTPWDKCNTGHFTPIPNAVIEAYYKQLIKQ